MAAVTSSEFWGPSLNAYSLLVNKNPRRNAIRRTVNRDSFRVSTELFDSLIGAAAGGAALATHARVGHKFSNNETAEATIVTVTDINRNTAAADVTALKEMVFGVRTAPTYVRDLSGNGGPAF